MPDRDRLLQWAVLWLWQQGCHAPEASSCSKIVEVQNIIDQSHTILTYLHTYILTYLHTYILLKHLEAFHKDRSECVS